MLVAIVAVVALVAIFVFGALVGSSVAHNVAGDRARRQERERRLTDVRLDHAGLARSTVRARDLVA